MGKSEKPAAPARKNPIQAILAALFKKVDGMKVNAAAMWILLIIEICICGVVFQAQSDIPDYLERLFGVIPIGGLIAIGESIGEALVNKEFALQSWIESAPLVHGQWFLAGIGYLLLCVYLRLCKKAGMKKPLMFIQGLVVIFPLNMGLLFLSEHLLFDGVRLCPDLVNNFLEDKVYDLKNIHMWLFFLLILAGTALLVLTFLALFDNVKVMAIGSLVSGAILFVLLLAKSLIGSRFSGENANAVIKFITDIKLPTASLPTGTATYIYVMLILLIGYLVAATDRSGK